jgi:hypothetical protein
MTVFTVMDDTGGSFYLKVSITDGYVFTEVCGRFSCGSFACSSTVVSSQWTMHPLVVFGNGTVSLSKDGSASCGSVDMTLDHGTTDNSPRGSMATALLIGLDETFSNPFHGFIDGLRVWASMLWPTHISNTATCLDILCPLDSVNVTASTNTMEPIINSPVTLQDPAYHFYAAPIGDSGVLDFVGETPTSTQAWTFYTVGLGAVLDFNSYISMWSSGAPPVSTCGAAPVLCPPPTSPPPLAPWVPHHTPQFSSESGINLVGPRAFLFSPPPAASPPNPPN